MTKYSIYYHYSRDKKYIFVCLIEYTSSIFPVSVSCYYKRERERAMFNTREFIFFFILKIKCHLCKADSHSGFLAIKSLVSKKNPKVRQAFANEFIDWMDEN